MLQLTNRETGEFEYINPMHVVLVSGDVDNVNLTLSTGFAVGHNFKGNPHAIAALVASAHRNAVVAL